MPHFLIDCSAGVLDLHTPESIIREVHDTAGSAGLFSPGVVKERIKSLVEPGPMGGEQYILKETGAFAGANAFLVLPSSDNTQPIFCLPVDVAFPKRRACVLSVTRMDNQ